MAVNYMLQSQKYKKAAESSGGNYTLGRHNNSRDAGYRSLTQNRPDNYRGGLKS